MIESEDKLEVSDENYVSIIHNYNPFFKKLTFIGAKIILGNGEIIKLKESQTIFKQRDFGDSIFIILYGKIIVKTNEDGILRIATPGESIGEGILYKDSFRYYNH